MKIAQKQPEKDKKIKKVAKILGTPADETEKILRNFEMTESIKLIATPAEAREFFQKHTNRAIQDLVVAKWNKLSAEDVRKANTVAKAINALRAAYSLGEVIHMALKKCLKLCDTIAKAKEVYKNINYDTGERRLVIKKWLSLCATPAEARDAYAVIKSAYKNDFAGKVDSTTLNSAYNEALSMACNRWDKLSMQVINKATTLAKVKKAIKTTREGSEARRQAIIKAHRLLGHI